MKEPGQSNQSKISWEILDSNGFPSKKHSWLSWPFLLCSFCLECGNIIWSCSHLVTPRWDDLGNAKRISETSWTLTSLSCWNNISYCLSSRARREAKPRRREKQSQGLLFPDWRMPGSLTPLSRFLVLRQNGLCMWVCAFKGMYECVCVCVCETGVKGPGEIFSLPCLKYPTLTHSFYEHLARALRGPWNEEGHPSLWASTLESTLLWNFVFIWCFFDCSMGERD